MIEELEDVILTANLPKYGLTRGDIGTVVLVHKQGKGYEVEFTTLDGESIAIVTLAANQVRPSKPREIAHVRDLTANP
jgi:ATP-dependent exoDNAse (exonuclease V) alpha subunit